MTAALAPSRPVASVPIPSLFVACVLVVALTGCATPSQRYLLVEQSLRAGDPKRADAVIEQSEKEYGSKSRLLYMMDRGMTLHLAGDPQTSNRLLEQANDEVERLYTRKLRTEAKAFLLNDTELPFTGESFEQVMINVVKAVNYALLGQWDEALVEARRIDQRLNVLSDQAGDNSAYRDDGFARYLSGILYEITGDLNNAFVAYRKSYDAYDQALPWSRTPAPPALRTDLLRITDSLHLTPEHEEYRRQFADVAWEPVPEQSRLAQVVMISYNGQAPHKEDFFIDLPISLDALNLVLLTKSFGRGNQQSQEGRAVDSVLYGLNGRVVRVALPRLVPVKTQVAYGEVTMSASGGDTFRTRTALAQNVSTLAEKNLSDRMVGISVRAVARSAVKYAMAEGVGRGAQAAAGKDAGPWVGILAGALAKAVAIGTEEADKRSWRTLPDEVQIARLWVPAGEYDLLYRPESKSGGSVGRTYSQKLALKAGETRVLTERVLF